MTIVKWNPNYVRNQNQWLENSIANEFDTLFNMFSPRKWINDLPSNLNSNIINQDDKYIISIDLPGMTKKEVSININNNILIIDGKRTSQYESKDDLSNQSNYGQFSKSYQLSDDIDQKNIKASMKNGVLEIILEKLPEIKNQAQSIKIS